ncbi:TetR/AcrR family transcriptional regulator [Salinibacterium soli]|uniref:TetR/AcrR family transcriptional regulator n=1 Tax=Antiquaquibacter soli TaxID=3064523 RepID=A0ABT9BTZ3_9MICO|nr:TetR/AcrR family transcriptional regulator [Protaetiibacter sp. WY-16]MDO7883271.1 TetR/AcrR family transcriptional regulator [Protaetiibacter sp. WY-16]
MDARQRRSRERLHAAVLELADATRADDLSVTAIAERAGIHRSTFYEHAGSPLALLRSALAVELDAARERYLEGVDPAALPAALRDVTRAVLEHVLRHADVYRRGLDSGGGLHDFLSEHFQGSSRLLLDRGLLQPPPVAGLAPEVVAEASIRYVADGTVGAIAVWLREPAHPEAFLEAVAHLVPGWWHMADADGGRG